ncbi:MAG TPA: DMT family transporter [Sphingobium sp.]|uniref:DMT family transporter n=1 Tax=Sphingobium sp. TaxID=1912891 RepID=UPI002ED59714
MALRPLPALPVPFLIACLGIAIFSAMDTVMKQLSMTIGSYNAMLWRTGLSLVVLVPLFLLRGGRWPRREVLILHAVRGCSLGVSLLLFFWGLARVPMALGVALTFIAPLIALGIASLFLKEKVGRMAVGASVIAFGGVIVILAAQPHGAPGTGDWHGPAAILIAAFFYAIGTVLSRPLAQRASPLEMALFFNIVAFSICLSVAPWYAIIPQESHVLPLIAAVISSNISMMLLAWAYARAEAQYLLPVEYTAFIWAVIYGWLVFAETVTAATLVGAVLIVAACLGAARSGARAAPTLATES